MYTVYQCWKLATVTTEGFADASVPTNVDTNNSIATLAQLATDLQSGGGLKVPGVLSIANDKWHTSLDGKMRAHYGTNSRTYFGSQDGYSWRNKADSDIMSLDNNGNMNLAGSITANRINILAPGGQNTHFPHTDGKNYIRGPTQQDGELTVNGGLNVSGRNILAELDALKATNAALRADLDDRTVEVLTRNHMPKGYAFGEGGISVLRDGWVRFARRG